MNLLREPLDDDQATLIRAIYEPFAESGEWPIWQYVDLILDALDLDAAAVLASLPRVRHPNLGMQSVAYGLIWHMNSLAYSTPRPDEPVALTVAGLGHAPEAEPLLKAFLATVGYLIDEQRRVVPSPTKVVAATVPSVAIADQVLTTSINVEAASSVDSTLRKLRQLLEHEPILWSGTVQRDPDGLHWSIRVPATLRALRGIVTIDDYLDRVVESVAPPAPPSVPISLGALDLPYAVGYLDAVWTARTGSRLFVNLDPASVARLTQPCANEEEFNSLMSALADVLGQVVPPGRASPPQGSALEALREQLGTRLDPEAADRVGGAIGRLIDLRHIRVGTQHSDARHRGVAAFERLGLSFPPTSWEQAWSQVAVLARGALDVLREEVHAGIPQDT